jgi:PTS system mannose-specific IIC component
MYFIPVFLAIYLGTDFVQGIVDAVPAWFTNGLNFAAKLLTAYGLSLLLSMMASKGMMVFFLLGFFGCAYLGLDVTGISIFGVLLALILMSVKYQGGSAATAAAGIDDDYDPLEDDEL